MSAIKTYVACPRRYFFAYVQKLQPSFRPLALVLGSAWHSTVDQWLIHSQSDSGVSLEELKAHLRDGIVHGVENDPIPVLFEEEGENIGEVVDMANGMLEEFVRRVEPPERVYAIEQAFRLELVSSATGEVLGLPVIGSIDALVEENGRPTVVEYKTSKRRWADQLEFDPQVTVYLQASRFLGYQDPVAKLVLVTKGRRPDVQVERLVRHRRDEQEFAEVALGVHRAIDAGVSHPIRGWQCKTCSYAEACGA